MKVQKTQVLVLSIWLLFLSSSAMSQIDPYPDSIGIYFDEGATENSQYISAPATVHAYLIATRISSPSGINSWGGGVSSYVQIFSTIRGDGENAFENVTDFMQQFDVTFSTPLLFSSAIVLADLYIPITDDQAIDLFLEPLFGHGDTLFYTNGTDITSLQPSVPCINIPCYPARVASINSDGPVMSNIKNWGDIKSLYR